MTDAFAIYPSLKGMPVVISGGASGIGEGHRPRLRGAGQQGRLRRYRRRCRQQA
jgi:NAD(P)-dependent dehydrogenase (short-subunit alcohol dehydrogenase family)